MRLKRKFHIVNGDKNMVGGNKDLIIFRVDDNIYITKNNEHYGCSSKITIDKNNLENFKFYAIDMKKLVKTDSNIVDEKEIKRFKPLKPLNIKNFDEFKKTYGVDVEKVCDTKVILSKIFKNIKAESINPYFGFLEVYEFPIQNEDIYKIRVSDKKLTLEQLMSHAIKMTKIEPLNDNKKDNNSSCTNNFEVQNHDTSLQSCDNIKFTYSYTSQFLKDPEEEEEDLIEYYTAIIDYFPDDEKIEQFNKSLVKILGGKSNDFLIKWFSECFDLVEINGKWNLAMIYYLVFNTESKYIKIFEGFENEDEFTLKKYFKNLVNHMKEQEKEGFEPPNYFNLRPQYFHKNFISVLESFEQATHKFCNNLFNNNIDKEINNDNISSTSFIHKLSIPKNSIVCLFGDFHGSIHTLLRSLLRLCRMGYLNSEGKIIKEDFYMFFLGDLIDRGLYGPEVLFTVMNLYILNPEKVFIIRGNHEDLEMSEVNGFRNGIMFKFYNEKINYEENLSNNLKLYKRVVHSWKYLPCAIFLKNNIKDEYIQLCHGGFARDIGFVNDFINSTDKVQSVDEQLFNDFKWSDYSCSNEKLNIGNVTKKNNFGFDNVDRGPNKGKFYTPELALQYMNLTKINGIIRGHQDFHNNTKLITYNKKDCEMEDETELIDIQKKNYIPSWEKLYDQPEYKNKFKSFLPKKDDIFSVKLPIPNHKNLEKIGGKNGSFFPPVYTFTTATSPRMIDSDGFGIFRFA